MSLLAMYFKKTYVARCRTFLTPGRTWPEYKEIGFFKKTNQGK